MDKNAQVFTYMVYPKTILRNIPFVGEILRAGSFRLTKEAVQMCLKGATVYRRFSVDQIERVNALNIDRLHNEKFMIEAEWESRNNDIEEDNINNIDINSKEEEEESSNNDSVVSDDVVDLEGDQNTSDEVITSEIEDSGNNTTEESSVEETITTVDEADIVEEAPVEDNSIEETINDTKVVEDTNVITEDSSDIIVEDSVEDISSDETTMGEDQKTESINIIDPVADYESSNNKNNRAATNDIKINYNGGKKKHK